MRMIKIEVHVLVEMQVCGLFYYQKFKEIIYGEIVYKYH